MRHIGDPTLVTPTQSTTEGQTHTGVETANAGTDSIVAPSRDMKEQSESSHPGCLQSDPVLGRPVSSPTPPWLGGQDPYPNPEQYRASPGTAPQLQSQLPQGLVQLIVHQVHLLGSQPEQLRLA